MENGTSLQRFLDIHFWDQRQGDGEGDTAVHIDIHHGRTFDHIQRNTFPNGRIAQRDRR